MFTDIPSSYKSLYSDIMFHLEMLYATDMTITIRDTNSGDIYGIKKFYSTTCASFNIAPIIRNGAIPKPSKGKMGFMPPENQGYVNVTLEDQDGEQTSNRTFLLSRTPLTLSCSEIMSTMPFIRYISLSESDLVTIKCQQSSKITVNAQYFAYGIEESVLEREYVVTKAKEGMGLFNFVPCGDLDGTDISSVDIEYIDLYITELDVFGEYRVIEKITYIMIDPPATQSEWRGYHQLAELNTTPSQSFAR